MNNWHGELKTTAFTCEQIPKISQEPEIIFAGRSNVGKSSLINALLNNKIAKVSSSPGKTRSINFYAVKANSDEGIKIFRLVDLPGFGYASCGKEARNNWARLIEYYLASRKGEMEASVTAAQLVDFRHGFLENDKLVSTYFEDFGIDAAVIFTKTDKISLSKRQGVLKNYIATGFRATHGAHLVSSFTKDGIENLKTEILKWL